jgi:ADP-ribose pyrophosphatase YjhB (NUDIX family)
MASTDSDLALFPRPSVAVDVAVMTVAESGELGVLVHRRTGDRAGSWALPGRFLRERERLEEAVATTVEEKCHLSPRSLAGRRPRQLHVFDDPARDDRGWVLSVGHLLAMPHERLTSVVAEHDDLVIAPIRRGRAVLPDGQETFPYGQDEIVTRARDELRTLYMDRPDPERFIEADAFTLTELGEVHFAVLGKEHWSIDTFRRKMSRQLRETNELSRGGPGRPAALYRRRG